MAKTLKKFNGRYNCPDRTYDHINIAAYSQKQAREILETVKKGFVGSNEIRDYFSDCWGNSMNGIEPTEPCAYLEHHGGKGLKKVY